MPLEEMYSLLEQGKKDKGKESAKDRFTVPDREGVSGDGNKSGIPRSYGTAAGDEWDGDPKDLSKETKAAQKKYPGNFDKEEMYRLLGIELQEASEGEAKVTKSDGKFYYVDVPGHGEVKVKKGNLLGIGEKGVPPDVILKALKAAGQERNREQREQSKLRLQQAKAWHSKKPESRSLIAKK